MKKRILIALFALTILISSASAITQLKETIREIPLNQWTETTKIEANEYLVYKFQGTATNNLDVTIEVFSGDSIDMLLFNSENFTEYQSMMKSGKPKPYNPYSTGKGMDLKYIKYSFVIPANDTYYIVEDNTYLPDNGGLPGGSVIVQMKFNMTRCLECEQAALEIQKKTEEANRISEAQRKTQEETNKSKEPQSTPGFESFSSLLVLAAVCVFSRKR
ncbi:Uncharacterised protein [uncultured archaeon]|nr:Uncharacterised protein [uncultured archaeon]